MLGAMSALTVRQLIKKPGRVCCLAPRLWGVAATIVVAIPWLRPQLFELEQRVECRKASTLGAAEHVWTPF